MLHNRTSDISGLHIYKITITIPKYFKMSKAITHQIINSKINMIRVAASGTIYLVIPWLNSKYRVKR